MPEPDGLQGADPFAVLGVPRDCTREMLHQAYRASARRYHPDVNTEPSAVEQMRLINAAFVAARRELMARARATSPEASHPVAQRSDLGSEAPNAPQSPVDTATTTDYADVLTARWFSWARMASILVLKRQGSALASEITVAVKTHHFLTRRSAVIAGVAAVVLAVLLVRLIVPALWAQPTQPARVSVPQAIALGHTTLIPWQGLGRVDLTDRQVGPVPVGSVSRNSPIDVSWSADGNYVALTTSQTAGATDVSHVIVLRAQSGQQIAMIPGFTAQWSPRDDLLAVLAPSATSSSPQLELLDLQSLQDAHFDPLHSVIVSSAGQYLSWSPTGDEIAFSAQAQRELRVYDLNTGSPSTIQRVPPGAIIKPRLWLDDHTILFVEVMSHSASLEALSTMTTTQQPRTVVGAVDPKSPVAWSMGLSQILYTVTVPGQSAGTTYLLQEGTTQLPEAIPAMLPAQFLVGWSTDDQWLSLAGPGRIASRSSICLVRASRPMPLVSWDSKCLAVDGSLLGVAWEGNSSRLSYVRQVPGQQAAAELREINIRVVSQVSTPTVGALSFRQTAWLDLALLWIFAVLSPLAYVRRRIGLNDDRGTAINHNEKGAHTYTDARRPRIAIISEALKWPPDEALKRTAYMLVQGMARFGDVQAVGTGGGNRGPAANPVEILRTNRAFLDWKLWRWSWRFGPDVVVYLPGSGLTTSSLLRSLVLRLMCFSRWKRPVIVLVSIQPRRHHRWMQRWLLRALAPVLLTVESPQRRAELAAQGIRTHLLAGGVDPVVFCPVDEKRRDALRRAYGITPDRFVVLHVGHLKQSRNLEILKTVRYQIPKAEVVLVASTSTVPDHRVVSDLSEAGVRIINRYMPHVEELYQLADCYVFPVHDPLGCAEMPLSVLEALACGVQVVTTRFGALPDLLSGAECIRYYETSDEMITAIRDGDLRARSARVAREVALRHSWTQSTTRLANDIRSLLPDT